MYMLKKIHNDIKLTIIGYLNENLNSHLLTRQGCEIEAGTLLKRVEEKIKFKEINGAERSLDFELLINVFYIMEFSLIYLLKLNVI